MAISWGDWYGGGSNSWRVGIEYYWDGANSIVYDVWVDAMYPVADNQVLYHSTGNVAYYLGTTAETKVVEDASINGVNRGTEYTIDAWIDRTTIYTGGMPTKDPSHTVWVWIPALPPDAPSTPTFSEITSTTFRARTNYPEDNGESIWEWQFQRATNVGMTANVVSFYDSDKSRTISGLTRATLYYVRARCRNDSGWSNWSGVSSVTTLTTVPAAYPAPTVSSITSSSATFGFGTNPDNGGVAITQSQLQVATNSTFTNLVYDQIATTGVVISGLTIATTYYGRTRAYNSVGWGPWSQLVQFTTVAVVPSQPVAPTVGTITQSAASASWGAPSSGGSVITSYDIQIATNSGFSTGLVTTNVLTLSHNYTTLSPGTAYWVRVRANNAIGSGSYSTATAFTTVSGKPAIVSTTTFPSRSRTNGKTGTAVYPQGWYGNFTITVNIATNDTFSTGLVTLTSTPATVGNFIYELSNANLQANGTYYVRAKVKNNVSLYETEWSDTVSYTQSHTPTAVTVSPSGDVHVKYAATTNFVFQFVDSAQTPDKISAYQLVVENNSTGAVVYDSTKTALVTTDTTITRSVAIAAGQKNIKLRWKVMVWDSNDQASVYSGYNLFTLADAPVVVMVTPGATVESGNPLFEWTATFPSGGIQASAVLNIYAQETGALVWGKAVSGTGSTIQPAQVILQNGNSYNYTLTITDTYGLITVVNDAFTVSYVAPDATTYDVIATEDQLRDYGYVLVDWSSTAPDSRLDSWVIYRRELPSGDWIQIAELYDIGLREYHDWTVLGNVTYQYSVAQKADRSGIILESPVGYYIPGGVGTAIPDPRTFTVVHSNYWLIFEDDEASSLMLYNVTGDSFTEEYESATYTVVGRGRHRDYGTRLGYTGTLEIHLRGSSSHANRKALEAIRGRQDKYYLRTPFGDMFPVALGDPSVSFLPSTGPVEMSDISVSYEEVYS